MDPPGEFARKHPSIVFEMLLNETVEFREDGTLVVTIPRSKMPEEQADLIPSVLAASKGETVILERSRWKMEDGKLYWHDKAASAVTRTDRPNWSEIPVRDGKLVVNFGMRLSRIE